MRRSPRSVRCTSCRVNVQTCTVYVARWTQHGYRGRVRLCRPCGEQLFKWLAEYAALMQGAVA